jgi:hypothetical protein
LDCVVIVLSAPQQTFRVAVNHRKPENLYSIWPWQQNWITTRANISAIRADILEPECAQPGATRGGVHLLSGNECNFEPKRTRKNPF